VRRDVVRLVTPGTITEEVLLDPARANAFAAVARSRSADGGWLYGLASVDISTGAFTVIEREEDRLAGELARLEPRRDRRRGDALPRRAPCRHVRTHGAPVTPLGRDMARVLQPSAASWIFMASRRWRGLARFRRPNSPPAPAQFFMWSETQKAERPALARPSSQRESRTLDIDAATRANLEISRTLAGAREGSLVSVIDCTVTPAGARLLAERVGAPSTDSNEIARRLDAVSFFFDNSRLREGLRTRLNRAPDLARALSRLSLQRAVRAISPQFPPALPPRATSRISWPRRGADGSLPRHRRTCGGRRDA